MTILYLDTTSSFLYAGIIRKNKLIAEINKNLGKKLSNYSLSLIKEMLDKNNITLKDISKIMVVNGPGSFTGIRIGITIAKTCSWALNIPIVTISSLEAMAVSCSNMSYKIPLIDARRDYSYFAIYNEKNEEIFKSSYMPNDYIKEEIIKLGTNNYSIITNDYDDSEHTVSYNPDILKIVLSFKDRDSINSHSVNPYYLKLTEAEEKQQ